MRSCTVSLLKRITSIDTIRQLSTMAKRIAVCQMTSVADKAANMSVVSQLVSDAAKEDVQMIFFPEACDFICDNKQDTLKSAESILNGNTVNLYKQLAVQHNVWMSMGGLHEKNENDPNKLFNTHIIINNKGEIVQTYRKLHLFDVEIPEKNVRLKESDFCTPGSHVVAPVDTPVGKIGLAICYDMRFPELSTSLSFMRAEILTFPSAFTYATGLAHWHIILRTRAIENQCYVIAAAQTGSHNAKRRSFGHALCVDPWGEVLADCEDSTPCYKIAEISTDKLVDVRRNMPVFQHRRPDVYSLYTLSVRNQMLPEHSGEAKKPKETPPENQTPAPSGEMNVFGHVRVPESCVFFKSHLTYAFVNLRCVIPGHVLVAPLRLVERNKDLTDEEAEDFYKTVILIQKLMETVHKTQSCTVTIQDGPDAGQTVKHLHCHIMPRKKGDFIENDLIYLELAKHDHLKSGHPSKPARSLEEMEKEAAMLREELNKMKQNS
ncbi:nitrilase and fragile histidine triad fusion protein NitFhit isoform X1 [Maniola jurtina]|uniref:nitrilase and fragile histidine triad fusion protein NitFhit isoform X1 n=2 Tax=Maniola jurtina TaxID=191418 RepID=UPI001E68F164|nr:nitrilase and fragile histidine triad fusion protein NitFhit isoform X1 [Maniola jurtina]